MNNVKCKICNRTIRSPDAIKKGMGKTCYYKWKHGYRGLQETIDTTPEEIEKMKEEIKLHGK